MPEISRFLGVVIAMYYNDHVPPHFHARYGDFEVTVRIADGVVEGNFPRRALNLVIEWYTLHQIRAARRLELGPRTAASAPHRPVGVAS